MTDNLPDTPLSDEEYAALDALLRAPERGGRSMDVSMLEGLLTALAIGPNPIMPDRWLPLVWDKQSDEQKGDQEAGEAGAGLASPDETRLAIGLIMRHYHHMVEWMTKDPGSFEPIYECGPEWSAQQWCAGFLLGTQLDAAPWALLLASQPALFTPFMRLGNPDGQELTEQDGSAARWMAEVTPSVIKIDAFWKAQSKRVQTGGAAFPQQPVLRETPKVGRNDPCHCGSGKKHKKCCA